MNIILHDTGFTGARIWKLPENLPERPVIISFHSLAIRDQFADQSGPFDGFIGVMLHSAKFSTIQHSKYPVRLANDGGPAEFTFNSSKHTKYIIRRPSECYVSVRMYRVITETTFPFMTDTVNLTMPPGDVRLTIRLSAVIGA